MWGGKEACSDVRRGQIFKVVMQEENHEKVMVLRDSKVETKVAFVKKHPGLDIL